MILIVESKSLKREKEENVNLRKIKNLNLL